MKKLLALAIATSAFIYAKEESSVIPNASYLIYDKADEILRGAPSNYTVATFYTAQGDVIQKVDRDSDGFGKEYLLDPLAPKPQPVCYAIKYWPAFRVKFGGTKGAPGYFIIFYDKNGNAIKSYRFNKEKNEISVFIEGNTAYDSLWYDYSLADLLKSPQKFATFPLDLSAITQQ